MIARLGREDGEHWERVAVYQIDTPAPPEIRRANIPHVTASYFEPGDEKIPEVMKIEVENYRLIMENTDAGWAEYLHIVPQGKGK